MVQGTFRDETGEEYISYIDSNRGLDERVRVGTIKASDPTIQGFFRGKLRPEMQTGTDSPSSAESGTEIQSPTSNRGVGGNPFITPGRSYTPAQQFALEEKWQDVQAKAQDLLSGGDKDDISTDIR